MITSAIHAWWIARSNACGQNFAPSPLMLIASNRCADLAIGSTDMQTIRARLSLNYLIVLLLGMTLAGALVWLAVSGLYVDTQRENLLAQVKLIAAGLQDSPLPTLPAEPYLQTSNVMPGVHTRLIGESGAVLVGLPLADEVVQLPAEQAVPIPPRDLIQRPEIDS